MKNIEFRFTSVIHLLTVLFCYSSIAQQLLNQRDTANLSTPYNSVKTHLQFLQGDSYYPEISAKVFSSDQFTDEKAENLAIKLIQILDGKGLYIDLDLIPNDPNYIDSITLIHRFVLVKEYPDIYLEKSGNQWFYSDRTADIIPILHQEVFPFGTLPQMGSNKYFGLYIWQYIGILILVIASFLVHKVFTFILDKLITGVLFRSGYKEIARKFIVPLARPISIFSVFLILKLSVPVLQLPIKVSQYIILFINGLLPFFAALVFYRGVDILALYFEKLTSKTESTLDDQLVPLIRKALKTFVVIIGALFVLQNLQIEVLPLIAGLSIGGLAFALAAQDTVKNFFGSLMIFIDKPFQIGDWITSGDIDGTVEEVGIRSTRIRTFRNSVVYVPNGNLANATVDNHGLRVYRRFYTQIAINYDTPPDLIELYIEGLGKLVDAHSETRKDYYEIHLNDMADSSLKIMFYIFFKVPTWSDELRCRHEIIISIMNLAKELGINFAFPTQTIHIENLPGQLSLSPKYDDPTITQAKLDNFLKQ